MEQDACKQCKDKIAGQKDSLIMRSYVAKHESPHNYKAVKDTTFTFLYMSDGAALRYSENVY